MPEHVEYAAGVRVGRGWRTVGIRCESRLEAELLVATYRRHGTYQAGTKGRLHDVRLLVRDLGPWKEAPDG